MRLLGGGLSGGREQVHELLRWVVGGALGVFEL